MGRRRFPFRVGEGADSDSRQPYWFQLVVVWILSAVVGFALAAVPLAMLGLFRPLAVGAAAALLAVSVGLLWGRSDPPREPVSYTPFAAALVLALAFFAFNARMSSEHFWVDSDPGVYLTTAQWLAEEGTLLVDGHTGPFVRTPLIEAGSPGYYPGRSDGRLYAQFLHLFPSMLAVGAWVGGTSMLLNMNALLGAIGLLMVFALGSRFLNPWLALAAMAALGLSLPEVHFSRDTFSEPLSQVFLFGGLWAYWTASAQADWRKGLFAGLLLGALSMTRIDGLLPLAALIAVVGIEVVRGRGRPGWGEQKRRCLATLGGASLPVAIAIADGWFFARPYIRDLDDQLRPLAALLVVTIVALVVAVLAAAPLRRLAKSIQPHRRALAVVAAGAVVLGGAYAAGPRPHLVTARQADTGPTVAGVVEANQAREGIALDGKRTFAEDSVRWMSWYLGPFTLLAGIGGAGLLAFRLARGEAPDLLAFTLLVGAGALLYLWRPSIVPIQMWASRRLLPAALPGLVLLAFFFVGWLWTVRERTAGRTPLRLAAVVLTAGALAFPLSVLAPLAAKRNFPFLQGSTDTLCAKIPSDAAVLFTSRELGDPLLPTVRSFCGVPAARALPGITSREVRRLAREWRRRGRRLYSAGPAVVEGASAGSPERMTFFLERLETTISRRPSKVESGTVGMTLSRVD